VAAIVLIALSLCAFSMIRATIVRVGFYENPPKLYTDESGQITGFFPEILAVIAEQEDWKLEYVPGTWSENLTRLEAGEIDLMPDVAYSEERAGIYGFSQEPLFVNWDVIYAPPGSISLSIADLAGKRIAVMAGSIHTEGTQGIKALLAGFDVVTAGTAEEGLALAHTEAPDVIVMDIGLPGMDGLEATRILKADPVTRDIPVLAATSHAMKGDEGKTLAVGCDGYVSKPLDTRTFAETVAGFLD